MRTITFSFSSLDTYLMLYISLVRTKLVYASLVWNSLTKTDSNGLERVGFEVLTVVVMKSTLFWDITPWSPLSVKRRFG
jgi:hypothetical protein